MAPPAGEIGAYARRQAFRGASGPSAILKSGKAFRITCFACIGGWVFLRGMRSKFYVPDKTPGFCLDTTRAC